MNPSQKMLKNDLSLEIQRAFLWDKHNASNDMRNIDLAPSTQFLGPDFLYLSQPNMVYFHPEQQEQERYRMVNQVAAKRAQLLEKQSLPPIRSIRGRLLAFDANQSLSDGSADLETNGFIDKYNMPGWDCWLRYFVHNENELWSNFLLSWVPQRLVEWVNNAILVNPEKCILWASDCPVHLMPLFQEIESEISSS